jgi:hypothetical protein
MPTFPCPDCGNQCSTLAAVCPQCGRPFGDSQRQQIAPSATDAINSTATDSPDKSESTIQQRRVSVRTKIIIAIIGFLVSFFAGLGIIRWLKTSGIWSESAKERNVNQAEQRAAAENNIKIIAMVGPRPVAGETFHLLDDDLSWVLNPKMRAIADEQPAERRAEFLALTKKEDALFYLYDLAVGGVEMREIQRKINAHTVKEVTTDSDGTAIFDNVTVGKFFVFGAVKTGDNLAVWDVPVNHSGSETVTLDRNNAVMAK